MKRVVLVEDDALMREVLRRGLERDGYSVSAWGRAEDALTDIVSTHPGLVVSDVNMPGMGGVELVRELRNRHLDVSVVLITADPTPEVAQAAVELGARVLRKPVGGVGPLATEIASAYRTPDVLDEALRVDTLRLDLITDLSHQLRTPLTAMRLALDGLFSQLEDVMNGPQHRLADISRRSVDRVIELVENQMTLLQMVLGEVAVSRRLVDLNELVGETVSDLFAGESGRVRVESAPGPAHVFTDPDRVAAVLRTLLCGGPPSAPRRVMLRPIDGAFELLVSVQLLSGAEDSGGDPADAGALRLVAPPGKIDFEQRAYGAIVEELGGIVFLEKDNNEKHARIVLPVAPEFDRGFDFVNGVCEVRRSAVRDGKSVALVKLLFEDGVESGDCGGGVLGDVSGFLADCRSVVSPGDRILRGREARSYYLVFTGRSREEVARVHALLEARASGIGCRVHLPQFIVEDASDVGRIVDSIEELI